MISAAAMEVSKSWFSAVALLIVTTGYCSNEYYCNDLGSHSMCCPTESMPLECKVRLPQSSTKVDTSTSSKSQPAVTPTQKQGSDSAAHSNRLSTEAKVGIGVGATLAAVALIVLAAWFAIGRRKKLPSSKTDTVYVEDRKELDDTPLGRPPEQELDTTANISEVAGVAKPVEVGSTTRHELEGDWHGHEAHHEVNASRLKAS